MVTKCICSSNWGGGGLLNRMSSRKKGAGVSSDGENQLLPFGEKGGRV